MKHFLPSVLVLVTGCSTMQSNPVSHLPQKSLVHMPNVAVVGDALAAAMVTQVQQQYPLWVNDGSQGQEPQAACSKYACFWRHIPTSL